MHRSERLEAGRICRLAAAAGACSLPMSDELLFVYGTLRRGSGHPMHELLARSSTFVDRAVFQGRLFMVAHYPGAVASSNPRECVLGDVYALRDPASLLNRLDHYERCDRSDPRAPFVRERAEIALDSATLATAWIYLYNRSTRSLPLIPSGDFFQCDKPGIPAE